jgi:hypothetical protein
MLAFLRLALPTSWVPFVVSLVQPDGKVHLGKSSLAGIANGKPDCGAGCCGCFLQNSERGETEPQPIQQKR